MSLGKDQETFSRLITKHLQWLFDNGYEVRLGDCYRDPRVHGEYGEKVGYGAAKSQHKKKLALDINLFKDGIYLTTSDGHKESAIHWESLNKHCRSGIRYSDSNHYEYVSRYDNTNKPLI